MNDFRKKSASRGSFFINLILILTVVGLVALIVFQVVDLQKYIGR